ncbi:ATP-dependent helicase [Synechococcus sp. CBW1107]|uniref:ATP-dependent helicase n=1 Tax=Synechococcus sp. CBW1107 TaxID=2789857 RepID=UPI002AD4A3E5|nr:ATP-dependent helicase [Synechococcus sp. CBW1107]
MSHLTPRKVPTAVPASHLFASRAGAWTETVASRLPKPKTAEQLYHDLLAAYVPPALPFTAAPPALREAADDELVFLDGLPRGGGAVTTFNTAQQQAIDLIDQLQHEISYTGAPTTVAVTGAAGTGKTAIVPESVSRAKAAGFAAVVLSPTHRVVSVNASRLAAHNLPDVPVGTIHAAIGLRDISEGEGPLDFQPVGDASLPAGKCVCFVDESGMVPPGLWRLLVSRLKDTGSVIVALGDLQQVPFIGADPGQVSPSLDSCIHQVNLTEPMRAGGLIYQAAQMILEAGDRYLGAIGWVNEADETTRIHAYETKAELEAAFLARVAVHAELGLADKIRFIVATNEEVDRLGDLAHAIQFGLDADAFVPGETLLTRAPAFAHDATCISKRKPGEEPERPVLGTSAEITVLDADLDIGHRFPGMQSRPFPVWTVTVRDDHTGDVCQILALDPCARKPVAALQKQLADLGNKLPKGSKAKVPVPLLGDQELERGQIWWRYWVIEKLVGHRAHPRSVSTVHRAQGGEWPVLFVDRPGIEAAKQWGRRNDAALARRMLYTGVTRCRGSLHLLGRDPA